MAAILIDFPKTFDLVPQDWLLTKIASLGVESRAIHRELWPVIEMGTRRFLGVRCRHVRLTA
jgi:hypothetical protein